MSCSVKDTSKWIGEHPKALIEGSTWVGPDGRFRTTLENGSFFVPVLGHSPKSVFDMFDQEVLDVIVEIKDIQDIEHERNV